jgi:SWI/SNF-related matrix-associated actin-dependent regulator of chromatin subfamily B protein 1
MRYTAVDPVTDAPFAIRPGEAIPTGTKFYYYPRIKCKDCPGKLYTPGPGTSVDGFEVHLKNRAHRAKVLERTGSKAEGDSAMGE